MGLWGFPQPLDDQSHTGFHFLGKLEVLLCPRPRHIWIQELWWLGCRVSAIRLRDSKAHQRMASQQLESWLKMPAASATSLSASSGRVCQVGASPKRFSLSAALKLPGSECGWRSRTMQLLSSKVYIWGCKRLLDRQTTRRCSPELHSRSQERPGELAEVAGCDFALHRGEEEAFDGARS